ncbi:hypothetical protein JZ751_002383, partial [Albula glossodonta]
MRAWECVPSPPSPLRYPVPLSSPAASNLPTSSPPPCKLFPVLAQFKAHPLSLCNTSDDELQDSIFISIIKLESPERKVPRCLPLLEKVLMSLVNKNEEAMVRIEVLTEVVEWPQYDLGILLIGVLAVMSVTMAFAFRFRCMSKRSWDSVHQQTMQAVSRLETRRYSSQRHPSSSPACAICLEDFLEGQLTMASLSQDLRIISCAHEFHKECVDPWLLQHRTCPLCMHNIMGKEMMTCQATFSRHQQNAPHNRSVLHPHPSPGRHPLQQYPISVPIPSHRPPARPYGSSLLSLQAMHCLPRVHLGLGQVHCSYHKPEGHLSQPHRCNSGSLTDRHFGHGCLYHPCYICHSACPKFCSSHPQAQPHPSHTGFPQDDGSCSGVSYDTEHSGYLADGPASDSSSGPCHGSSSDSVPNCTDISLQAVYGSWSTSRSSLSSEYDPWVYCGLTQAQKDGRKMDEVRGPAGLDPEERVFSHIHYHQHQHHHYSYNQRLDWGSDDEQGAAFVPGMDKHQLKQKAWCSKVDPSDTLNHRTEDPECEPTGVAISFLCRTPLSHQAPPPCCPHYVPRCHQYKKKKGFVLEETAIHQHQSLDPPEDCSICYGQGTGFCPCLHAPPRLSFPFLQDPGSSGDLPSCRGHMMRLQRPPQAQSEPQLHGLGASQDCSQHP